MIPYNPAGIGRDRDTRFGDESLRGRVRADHGTGRISRPVIDLQYIFGAGEGRADRCRWPDDGGERRASRHCAMLERMAAENGFETPTTDDQTRLFRWRKGKKLSNADRESPTDQDARMARLRERGMKGDPKLIDDLNAAPRHQPDHGKSVLPTARQPGIYKGSAKQRRKESNGARWRSYSGDRSAIARAKETAMEKDFKFDVGPVVEQLDRILQMELAGVIYYTH